MEAEQRDLEQLVDEWQVPDPFDVSRLPHLGPKVLALARDLARTVHAARNTEARARGVCRRRTKAHSVVGVVHRTCSGDRDEEEHSLRPRPAAE